MAAGDQSGGRAVRGARLGCHPSALPPSLDYIFLFRFDTLDHLRAWEESDTRHQWLTKLDLITAEMVGREGTTRTGMEVWFTPPRTDAAAAATRWWPVTMLGLYLLVMLVQLNPGAAARELGDLGRLALHLRRDFEFHGVPLRDRSVKPPSRLLADQDRHGPLPHEDRSLVRQVGLRSGGRDVLARRHSGVREAVPA